MKKQYVVGIDLGTSACKTALVDERMRVVAVSRQGYAPSSRPSPAPGFIDQDPAAWFEAVKNGVREVARHAPCGEDIRAIGFSGQMHGLIALDCEGNVIRPCITCNDSRGEIQCAQIYELLGGPEAGRARLLKETNNYMFPSFTAAKLKWMVENEPELAGRTAAVINPNDYIRYMFTGEICTDVSDACGYGLFNARSREWSNDIIGALGFDKSMFPRAAESDEAVGKIKPALASELGLVPGTVCAAGGGDAVVQTAGGGAVFPGAYAVTLGTGALVAATFEEFKANTHGTAQMFCANAPHTWMAFGGTGGGGKALEWLKSALYGHEDEAALGKSVYSIMAEEAASVPPGAYGLLFYPMLVGQRCPYEDADTSAAFIGLRPEHGAMHLTRSLMEGVSLCLRDSYGLINDMCGEMTSLSITGGGAESDLWCQILSDVFQTEAVRYEGYKYGGAVGACMIAGRTAKLWNSLKAAAALMKADAAFTPNRANAGLYDEMLAAYQTIYPSLKNTFHTLASIRRRSNLQ